MSERLSELAKRKEQALHAGSERSVERQHAKGKMLARERIDFLLDEGSFHELDMLARHRAHDSGLPERPYTDGVVTGWGTIHGRKVFLFSQDFTVFGGALGEVFAEKIHKLMDLAIKVGAPLIGLNDGAGRPHPGGPGLPRQLRRHLPPQRDGLRCDPADQRDPRALCRGCRVLPRHDRLHLHGEGEVAHVHHGPRRGEDGHRRGGHPRGARRRHVPRIEERRVHLRGRRRGDRARGGALPPRASCRRTTSRSRRTSPPPTTPTASAPSCASSCRPARTSRTT